MQADPRIEVLKSVLSRAGDVSQAQLCRLANMDAKHLSLMVNGHRPIHDRTLTRLRFAVQRLRSGESEGLAQTNALYRALVVICAQRLGLDAESVQATDTRAKRVANPQWLAAAQCHQVARFLMCEVFALRQVDLARSLGLTKQAMQLSIAAVANRAEADTAFDTMLTEIAGQLLGGVQ